MRFVGSRFSSSKPVDEVDEITCERPSSSHITLFAEGLKSFFFLGPRGGKARRLILWPLMTGSIFRRVLMDGYSLSPATPCLTGEI